MHMFSRVLPLLHHGLYVNLVYIDGKARSIIEALDYDESN